VANPYCEFAYTGPDLCVPTLNAVWELYTGQAAFRKLHVGQFFEAIVVRNLRPMIPGGMAADYQLLMQSCWSADPNDRCVGMLLAVWRVLTVYAFCCWEVADSGCGGGVLSSLSGSG
jgi:hypothetical protein